VNEEGPSTRDLARRYVEETLRLGTTEWVLDRLTRADALELARGGRGEGRRVAPHAPPRRAGAGRDAGGRESRPAAHGTVAGATSARWARTVGEPVGEATIEGAASLEELAVLVAGCTRCPLHAVRRNPVFGEGAADARVVCVGEAPGGREDETGRPFVGRAGRLLDRLLLTIGLPRASVYICNVLKSRPPQNRDPLPEEVKACTPFLLRQLALIRPEIIVAFGAFAARTLLDSTSSLGRMRGAVHRYAGYPVVVTYHPAALLRNPGWIRPTWEDLQIVRRLLDGDPPVTAGGGHG